MSDGQQVLVLGGGLAGLSFAIALATDAFKDSILFVIDMLIIKSNFF